MQGFIDFVEKAEELNVFQKNRLKRIIQGQMEKEEIEKQIQKDSDRKERIEIVFKGIDYVVVEMEPAFIIEGSQYPFTAFVESIEGDRWIPIHSYYEKPEEALFAALAWKEEGPGFQADKYAKKMLGL